ncbi:DUF2184 domain-containing protein [Acidobacteria bacterium AB60]|nr:DUF2184 domain-containing protein [Acidobacteria bacterium AB60]
MSKYIPAPRQLRQDPALEAALRSSSYRRAIAALRSRRDVDMGAADAVSTGSIFLQSELNKADTRLHMPMEGHTWFQAVPLTNGGGWVDTETAEFVAGGDTNVDGTGTGANDIGVVNFQRSQDVYPTFAWQRSVRIPLIESLKLAQANKSPNDILDKFIRLTWNKTMDQRVYLGPLNQKSGQTGLVNSTLVTAQAAPNGTQGTPSPSWNTKNPIDLVNDVNSMAKAVWAANGYDTRAIPNRFLIPATAWDRLLQPMYLNVAGTPQVSVYENVLKYIEENYYGRAFGVKPEFLAVPNWLETAGAGNTRRIMAYRFDDEYVNFGILQDLQRVGGPLSLQDGAFVATYVGNTGIVKFLAPTTALYYDQI